MDSVEGLRSMAHLPTDERQRLATERERACAMLTNRINALKSRVARKDDLLNGYEQDLGKLRWDTGIHFSLKTAIPGIEISIFKIIRARWYVCELG